MTNQFTFTDDQLHWLRVALENSKANAQQYAEIGDDEDVTDGLLLIEKYNELEGIIGTTDGIHLNPDN